MRNGLVVAVMFSLKKLIMLRFINQNGCRSTLDVGDLYYELPVDMVTNTSFREAKGGPARYTF